MRGVLIAFDSQVGDTTASLVNELIDASECGIALEILTEMLAESRATVGAQIVSDVAELSNLMGLGSALRTTFDTTTMADRRTRR